MIRSYKNQLYKKLLVKTFFSSVTYCAQIYLYLPRTLFPLIVSLKKNQKFATACMIEMYI